MQDQMDYLTLDFRFGSNWGRLYLQQSVKLERNHGKEQAHKGEHLQVPVIQWPHLTYNCKLKTLAYTPYCAEGLC